MSLQSFLLAILVVLYGAAQYALMVQALRDLARRPRVRGGNKVTWGIVILTIPIAGALLYSWMGPTSLMRRSDAAVRPPPVHSVPTDNPKVTPIRAARAARAHRETASPATTRRVAAASPTTRLRPPARRQYGDGVDSAQDTSTPRTGS